MEELHALDVPLDPMLVEASAGTGKTWTITALHLRLLLEKRMSARSILVVTFTRAATSELRDRIRSRVREALRAASGGATDDLFAKQLIERRGQQRADAELLQRALSDLDEAPIATLHAFCQRVLMERAFDVGGPLALDVVADNGATPADRWSHERWLRAIASSPLVYSCLPKTGASKVAKVAALANRWPDLAVQCAVTDDLRPLLAKVAATERTLREVHASILTRLAADPFLVTAYVDALPLKQCTLRGAGARVTEGLRQTADEIIWEGLPNCTWLLCRDALAKNLRVRVAFPEHPIRDAIELLVHAYDALHEAAARLPQALLLDVARRAPRAIAEIERSDGYLGFDDLLIQLRDALVGSSGDAIAARLRESYTAALVDEFQDTDPVQYEIVRRIFGVAQVPLFLVGDPKQAIYGFRGADIHSYLDATARAGLARRSLQISQRADPPLVSALNTLFGHVSDPFGNPTIGYLPVKAKDDAKPRLEISGAVPPALRLVVLTEPTCVYSAPEAEAAMRTEAARDIVRLLDGSARIDGKRVRPGDIAVLVRANAEADAMYAALRDLGIPAVLATENSVLDTEEASELAQVLAAVVQPSNARRVRTALTTKLLGWSANDLEKLAATPTEGCDPMQWDAVVARFSAARERWRERGLYPAFRMIIDGERVPPRVLARERGDRRLANLLHLGEVLHDVGRRNGMGPEALLAWFELARANKAARGDVAADAQQIRLESDADAVRISNTHKTKGLEFPIVILPSLWRGGLFAEPLVKVPPPDGHLRVRTAKPDPAEQADLRAAKDEERREQMRVAYVALTRARHQIHVYLPNCEVFDCSALAKLLGVFETLPTPRGTDAERADACENRDAQLRAAATDLANANPQHISVEIAARDATPPRRLARDSDVTAAAIVPGTPPQLERDHFHVSSFSKLVSKGRRPPPAVTVSEERQEARDVEDAEAAVLSDLDGPRVALADFPRGRTTGDLLHAVLEKLELARATPDRVREVVVEQLRRARFAASLADGLVAALVEILDTPLLADAPLTLRDLAADKCIPELEFLLPVVADSSAGAGHVGPVMLATTLAQHGSALHARYAPHARALGFDAWRGFLHGFVDLVFEHDGRFYIVDYKSNHLGDRAASYTHERLQDVMIDHHYVLQYLLYCVALHRHLRDRIPDYDYDRHFGGALFLFLRGMSPKTGASRGIFHDRPEARLIEALSKLLEGVV